jgi:hypothetical protein
MTSQVPPANQTVTDLAPTEWVYEAGGRLDKVCEDDAADCSSPSRSLEYDQDALGRMTVRRAKPGMTITTTTTYGLDGQPTSVAEGSTTLLPTRPTSISREMRPSTSSAPEPIRIRAWRGASRRRRTPTLVRKIHERAGHPATEVYPVPVEVEPPGGGVMSPRFRPPGKTFKERWPHEAEETRYLASTTYAVVVGGVLGVLLVPFAIWKAAAAAPLVVALVLGLLALIAIVLLRALAPGRRWLALAWKIGVWLLGAAALGLVVDSMVVELCHGACGTGASVSRTSPLLITYALLVVGSVGIAIVADRSGNALRRRTPGLASPR